VTHVLLVSNVREGMAGGRVEKLVSRADAMTAHGVETSFGHVPEPYVRTALPSVVRLARRARREDVDVVASVSNPFHLQLIGYLVSRLAGVPWVAEFRDPMVTSPDRDPEALVTRAATLVEQLAVTRSDRVVWGAGIQLEEGYYADRYDVPADKAVKLPYHGFDPDAFEGLQSASFDDFTITYAGSFYDGWIEPYRFLDGLAEYVADGSRDLRVQFYGDWSTDYEQYVHEAGIDGYVETSEFVPHEELVPVLKGSDAALYVGGTDPGNRLNVPSKIWDYVGARVPILAVVHPSFKVAELIRKYDLGLVVNPREPSEIADAIGRLQDGTYAYDPPSSVFDRFTRERKAERYSELLHKVARTAE